MKLQTVYNTRESGTTTMKETNTTNDTVIK